MDWLPKLREDLRVSRQETREQIFFIVSDPITGKYIRLREPEYVILGSLDGKRNAADISDILKTRLNIEIPPETITKFVEKFDDMAFLETKKGEYLIDQIKAEVDAKDKSVLFYKIKAFNPERILEKLYHRLRFAFTPWFVTLSAILIVLGIYVLAGMINILPLNIVEIFGFTTFIVAVISLFAVIIMHEFAHALVCCHYGGRVREMGFLLIYFQPAFYCNLSDSYMFEKKSQKINTLAAGMYFQMLLGAVALLLWRIIKEGTFFSETLLVVAVISFGILIFNLNPLLKLDGYYLLTDAVDIPNLRDKAFSYAKSLFAKLTFGIDRVPRNLSTREKRIYISYAISALLYSFLLLYFLGLYVMRLMVDRWGGTGFLLFAAILAIIFRPLLMSTTKDVSSAVRDGAIGKIRSSRWIFWGALAIIVLLLLIFVRTDLRVTSQAALGPIERFYITTPEENVIKSHYYFGGEHKTGRERIYQLASSDFSVFKLDPAVAEGVEVQIGDTLLAVSSNLYKSQLAQAESEFRKALAEHDLLLSDPKASEAAQAKAEVDQAKLELRRITNDWERSRKMFNRGLISEEQWEEARTKRSVAEEEVKIAESSFELLKSGPKVEEVLMVEAEIDKLEARISHLTEQINASNFTAPFPGTVSSTGVENEILNLIRMDTIEVVVAVPEENIDVLSIGQRVVLKVSGYPAREFDGTVVHIRQSASPGENENTFDATCLISNPERILKPGMTGYAKIYCGKMSLGGKLVRKILRFFRIEFWSWW